MGKVRGRSRAVGLLIGAGLLPVLLPVLLPMGGAIANAAPLQTDASELSELSELSATAEAPEDMSEDMPEEILRTEIITEARSPLTGEPLNAAEYAQLQAELASPAGGNLVSEDIRYLFFLLQLRRAIKPIFPFIR